MNLDYFLFHLPRPSPSPPFFQPDGLGMSVLFTSPGLLFATQADWRRPRAWWLLGAAVAVLIPTLLYYGGGWLQYGYRYFLDSVPFVMALCGLGRRSPGPGANGMADPDRLRRRDRRSRRVLGVQPVTEVRDTPVRRMAAAADRLGWLALLLAAAICCFMVFTTMVVFTPVGRAFADWLTYVHAVERLLAGNPIYPAEQLSGPYVLPNVTLFGYAYPPSSVPLFIPFASWPFGLWAWLTLNVGVFITGLYAILRSELGRVRPLEFAVVLLGLAFMRGFTDGVAFGNASVGLAGVLAWGWVIGRGRAGIGLLAGLGATIKLVPGTMIFWSTPKTFARVLVTAMATGGALFVLTLPLVGIDAWFDYVRALSYSEPACGVDFPTSIACTLQPVPGIGPRENGRDRAHGHGRCPGRDRHSAPSLVRAVVVAWLAPATDLHFHYLLVVYVLAVAAYRGLVATATGSRQLLSIGQSVTLRADVNRRLRVAIRQAPLLGLVQPARERAVRRHEDGPDSCSSSQGRGSIATASSRACSTTGYLGRIAVGADLAAARPDHVAGPAV